MGKARTVSEVKKFTDIPNVGQAMERDFLFLGLKCQQQPVHLYFYVQVPKNYLMKLKITV